MPRCTVPPLSLLFLLVALLRTNASGQGLQGSYILRQQELTAVFTFKPEGRFDFIYSYGAIERAARGIYKRSGDTIYLQSDKPAGQDFRVTANKKGKPCLVKVNNEPTGMAFAVMALYTSGTDTLSALSDESGLITFKQRNVGQIWLQHRYYPDILTPVKSADQKGCRLEVDILPHLPQLSFGGIILTLQGDALLCPANYALPFENMRFVREP